MREQKNKKQYTGALYSRAVEWELVTDVEKILEYVKQSVVDSARVVCDLARVERKNPKGSGGPMRLKLLRRRDDILK